MAGDMEWICVRQTLESLFPNADMGKQQLSEIAEVVAKRFIARGITIERLMAENKALRDIRQDAANNLAIQARLLTAKPVVETPLGDDIDGWYPV